MMHDKHAGQCECDLCGQWSDERSMTPVDHGPDTFWLCLNCESNYSDDELAEELESLALDKRMGEILK